MKTYSITTLGCRVNHYESEQLATLLRERGLSAAPAATAELRIIHTCSVTVQAASKSRQTVRRLVRLPVLAIAGAIEANRDDASGAAGCGVGSGGDLPNAESGLSFLTKERADTAHRARVVVTGCWATSDPEQAKALPGVDAVLGHHQDVRGELIRLLSRWEDEDQQGGAWHHAVTAHASKSQPLNGVNEKLEDDENRAECLDTSGNIARNRQRLGTVNLPMLGQRQGSHQRAFLKVQDGCDAHCTYCIIPQLRPGIWSKPVEEAVAEAQRLTEAGHREIVLTGIFLGAYGQVTALRRRQEGGGELGRLVEALCTRVKGLQRLRLSSLEPGDLDDALIQVLAAHQHVVPHFHLPLQSGSDAILRKMNRQYSRGEFLEMGEKLQAAFDRPAITTDIIVGFPGETAEEFEQTVEVAERMGFVHIHAFSYSPRPGTAAARWTKQWVRGPVVNERIARLGAIAKEKSLAYRQSFVGEEVEVLVENFSGEEQDEAPLAGYQHGRCERYFAVHFAMPGGEALEAGALVRLRVDRVAQGRTFGTVARVLS